MSEDFLRENSEDIFYNRSLLAIDEFLLSDNLTCRKLLTDNLTCQKSSFILFNQIVLENVDPLEEMNNNATL